MNGLKIFFFIIAACLIASIVHADIYEWTDENGVRHFTNFTPPACTGVIIKTPEVPYDAVADQVRMEAERQERLELAHQEIAEREAELERREAEAERKLAEANRRAEEQLRKAEELLDEINSERNTYKISRAVGYYPVYYPNPGYGKWDHRGSYYHQRHTGGETHHPKQHVQSRDRHPQGTHHPQPLDINHYNRNLSSGLNFTFRLH